MGKDSGASTALATVGTVFWCIQLIPQIWYNWKKKDCTGLPPLMMFLWVFSGIPFAIYFCITAPNVILQIQPHLFMVFCGISFVQSLYYPPTKLAKRKIILITASLILFDIGTEVGFIIWLRPLYAKGVKWPALVFGIIASVLLAVGLLPPYFELAKRQGRVVGINFLFLTLDSLGAYFSIASVAVGEIDVLGIILYALIAGLELGIFLSHFIWCCRFKWFTKDKFEEEDQQLEGSESVSEFVEEQFIDKENNKLNQEKGIWKDQTKTDDNETQEITYLANEDPHMFRSVHGVNIQKNIKDPKESFLEEIKTMTTD
ncbi:hypothetical protein Kpol_1032p47 [Vanderwaltozyma polyspora DSM 70294]|uniref:Uncharacterized protein n=1 Tax=Vanderwaltozyma polyspora (strain ATCC 22028 / DSM 70294 / BCRC 21397 / CBS 2163 / NBRC 10782 / NRRL Y-8283 / UCD 57-17) TaxID=436907 RepID=A7TH01_VANPO|nr:uncharacterized protein Kpol_1032p47 [Vanderwaltozyma polyspora DSM 70294]EDO18453.1 hypothetical protein Kpol_1032p47 [Vanderwaltozyma polyspora DSM 70294]